MCHPILAATSALGSVLARVAEANPVFLSTVEKADALTGLARVQAQLDELRLRVLAAAADVAETTAARDAGEWLAHATHARFEDARADLVLAVALDRRYAVLGAALRAGQANTAQAEVIARALDALPGDVPTDVLSAAEQTLVEHCARFGPRQLARLARHILEVVAPDHADAVEARRLATLEAAAHRNTRLTLRRVGDGTTRLAGLLPDAAATRLATYLEAFTNPRKETAGDQPLPAAGDPFTRLPYPRRLGQAFCRLLEAVDPARLPAHGGSATTIMVTLNLEDLRADLATAAIIGASHVPGHDDPLQISASEARRLACNAGIIPVVLGADSEILDLGRTRRLFSPAQVRALRLRDRRCRAEGCSVPAAWAEAHHLDPWRDGGRTDLARGALLCSHHHHAIHDPRYRHELLPEGDIRIHRRT
jgi:hypothetical protein